MTGYPLWDFIAFDQLFNNSSSSSSGSGGDDDEKFTTGSKIAVVGTIIGIVLGLVFESWLCFIFIAAAGFIIGLYHDVYKFTEDKKKSDTENSEETN